MSLPYYEYMAYNLINNAIYMLARLYNVIIYNNMEPYVSPITNKITYCYAVKKCDINRGWNFRVFIGKSEYYSDEVIAKLEAVIIAYNYLILNNKESILLRQEKYSYEKLLNSYVELKKKEKGIQSDSVPA